MEDRIVGKWNKTHRMMSEVGSVADCVAWQVRYGTVRRTILQLFYSILQSKQKQEALVRSVTDAFGETIVG